MNVKEFLGKDRFVALLGIKLMEAVDGRAKASLCITTDHLNAVDTAQGGAIFSLADLTISAAANSHGTIAVTIHVSISFLKAAGEGILYAEAVETSRNSKIGSYSVNITDSHGEMIATAQGMAYFKKETFTTLPA